MEVLLEQDPEAEIRGPGFVEMAADSITEALFWYDASVDGMPAERA
jgi:hypothetical protein